MSCVLDETAADIPVRDTTVHPSQLAVAPQDQSTCQNVRTRHDISKVSREELEDRFLRLHEETLQLKQHVHKQDDKIRKLGTKLMRLVKDRGRMEQLAAGGAQPPSRLRDVEMEEMMEELQEKVRGLQAENEGLKQRLLVAKQQLLSSQSRRPTPYGHVLPRVNSGLKKLRDDMSSPSQTRPRSLRSLEEGGRPPMGLLPRYGHSLLEEARAEIRNLENVVESQQSRMEELEGTEEQLREELRKKEVELEKHRQQHTSTLRLQVSSNMSMIKLQKQLDGRSNAVMELEGRFLHLQEAQKTLKVSHNAAMAKVDELSAQLKNERLKNLELNKQLQTKSLTAVHVEQLQQQIGELEQERELLKEDNKKLLNSAFDASQQQKWKLQEQQLRLQISQLETALNADLADKNEILDKVKAERDKNGQLAEENQKLQIQFLEQKQQVEELKNRLKFYSRENDYSMAELTEALLLIKKRKSGDLGFLSEVEESSTTESSIRELRAAHAETIQELEKTRNLLNLESRISKDHKAELDAVVQRMNSNRVEFEQKLTHQAQLLDSRAAKINKLEAQLRDIAYGTKTFVFRPDLPGDGEEDEFDETLHLERGENLLELQIVGATLSPPALQALGDAEPSTFCTYSFYLFELHATPVATGCSPKYGYTSRYVVSVDDSFLDYLHRCSVTVELHQALGLDWRTVATGRLRLQQLMERDGKVHGSIPLVGTHEEVRSFGSVDYWLRLKVPMMETVRLYREKLKAAQFIHSQPSDSSRNQLFITVQRCSDLQSRTSQLPSPYVFYKFFSFPDSPTATVNDCRHPEFNDLKSYSVLMDLDLDRYLRSEVLQVYVLDYKEEQRDTYLGKARVPLLSLTQDQLLSGVFELSDPSGLPAGCVEVTLRWKFTYLPPPGVIAAAEEPRFTPEETVEVVKTDPGLKEVSLQDKKKDGELVDSNTRSEAAAAAAKEKPPRLRGPKTQEKDGPAAKRVTFMDPAPAGDQSVERSSAERSPDKPSGTFPSAVTVVSKPPQKTTEEEEDDEESHVSEGQLVPSAQSYSDDSDISEEIVEDVEAAPAAADHQKESTQSDSDDCIVQGPSAGRKPSERLRVEVVSLSLTPQSRLAQDDSVVRLFVEYNFLDLPTEETPLSLPKPPQGWSINYNYSKVIPVDAEKNVARRRLLRDVLQGRNPQMDRVRFTVVSEPPEEEEQERECEDVGVAYLRIPEILERREELTEERLSVLDVEDSSQVVGSLTVSVEGLEVLRAIMEDQDLE
ncbi:protein fantom isoform X1 [Kryptolebias marmoratus]|uniref:RPGRIP1 like n=2 Tax=Kryptolebias marmoratus TaxID=37003 RepID=A0A3Q3GIP2_KRYMA|nr:protein fantom isoform X1 [Kryptolebias marmoratus]